MAQHEYSNRRQGGEQYEQGRRPYGDDENDSNFESPSSGMSGRSQSRGYGSRSSAGSNYGDWRQEGQSSQRSGAFGEQSPYGGAGSGRDDYESNRYRQQNPGQPGHGGYSGWHGQPAQSGPYGQSGMGQQRWGQQGQQGGSFGQGDSSQEQFDPDYHQWRSEQMKALDDDYKNWRQDRYKKFSDEFSTWRSGRQKNESGNMSGSGESSSGSGSGGASTGSNSGGSSSSSGKAK
jgi:hypothetical protein